jgi:polyhydroxyalkanoate synthesis regulator phasin
LNLQRSASPGEYDEVARALQMSKGAVAAAVHRMTARFGELVKKVVRDSVADGEMAEEELTYLMRVLRR